MSDNKTEYGLVQTAALFIIASYALTASLIYLKNLLLPFVIAIFFYFAISPIVYGIEKRLKIHRVLAFLIVVLVSLSLISLVGYFFSFSIQNFVRGASIYQDRIINTIDRFTLFLSSNDIDLNFQKNLKSIPYIGYLSNATSNIVTFIGQSFLCFVFLLFFFISPKRLDKPKLWEEIHDKVSLFINIKFLMSLMTSILVGVFFWVIQSDLAFLFAVIVFFLNFIPNVGSIAATLIPLPVLFLQYDFSIQFWLGLSIPGACQIIIGNVIEPKLMGKNLQVHPVTILLSLMFWGAIWGIAGAIIAAPMAAILKITLEQFHFTRPIANLMSGNFSKI